MDARCVSKRKAGKDPDGASARVKRADPSVPNEESSRQLTAVHRVRFLEWSPSAAVASACTDDGSLLAIARESGNIEIWETEDWVISVVLWGCKDLAITCVAWMKDPWSSKWRLFSGGLDGSLIEWDLHQRKVAIGTDALGGAVWAIAVQPQSLKQCADSRELDQETERDASEGGRLAVACDDGCLRLFRIESGQDGLIFEASLPALQTRLLSVAWHPNGSVAYTGTSEASLHAWDVQTRREIIRIHTGDEEKERHDVWAVEVLPDGTMVTGDGGGNLQFWDSAHGSLISSIKQHQADILCLAASPDGMRVFASGVDSQVAVFGRVQTSQETDTHCAGAFRWEYLTSKRSHTHDVRFLSIVEIEGDQPLLISGGNDAQVFAYSVSRFTKEYPTRLSRIPEAPSIHMTSLLQDGSLLLASVQLGTCEIWRIAPATRGQVAPGLQLGERQRLEVAKAPESLSSVRLSQKGYISVSAMSQDGLWLFLGNADQNALYRLDPSGEEDTVSEQHVKGLKHQHFQAATFSTEGLLLVDAQGAVFLVKLSAKSQKLKAASLTQLALKSAAGTPSTSLSAGIRGASSSQNVTAIYTSCAVHLVGPQFQAVIQTPQGKGMITAVGFGKNGKTLMLATSCNNLLVYEVTSQQLMSLSDSLKAVLPEKLERMPGSITFISSVPDEEKDMAVIATPSSMMFLDFATPDSHAEEVAIDPQEGKKRQRWKMHPSYTSADDNKGKNARVLKLELPCLACAFASFDTLVVCERNWSEVESSFPPPLHRRRYGT